MERKIIMSENLIIAFIGAGGVILGTIITLLGGMWQSYLQSKREYKQHLREKREDVYKEACNVLMKEEEFIELVPCDMTTINTLVAELIAPKKK